MKTSTYLITGAGSGIGRATAIHLSKQGENRLLLVGRNIETLESTLQQMSGKGHLLFPMDILNKLSWKKMFSGMENTFSIEGVFANAGAGGENHYGENDQWETIISTNLTGSYTTIMECLPYMKKSWRNFRHIVITSSCLARFGVKNYTAYCTSKTGLLGLTRSLALELAPQKILINAICPGWVETEMAKASFQRLADREGISYEQSYENQKSLVPLNRISSPDEIAQLVEFLMSDRQNSITGQGIDINNGSFMI